MSGNFTGLQTKLNLHQTLKLIPLPSLSVLKREDLRVSCHELEPVSLHVPCALPTSPASSPQAVVSTSATSSWHCWGRPLLWEFVGNLVLMGNNKQFLACLKYSENPLLPVLLVLKLGG